MSSDIVPDDENRDQHQPVLTFHNDYSNLDDR
jgi:hypothetical protein